MGIDEVMRLLDERIEMLTKRMELDIDNRPAHAAAISALYDFKQALSN